VVAALLGHPELATVTRWSLNTNDAHGLYAKFGFVPLGANDRTMELRRADRGGLP
jgi:hypothetical protein